MEKYRTWEQMRSDNEGATWIVNGEFCERYKRDMMSFIQDGEQSEKTIAFFEQQQKLSGWKQIGFNGCWSCAHTLECLKQTYIKE